MARVQRRECPPACHGRLERPSGRREGFDCLLARHDHLERPTGHHERLQAGVDSQ